MGADDDIDIAFGDSLLDLRQCLRRDQARCLRDIDRKAAKTFGKGFAVLARSSVVGTTTATCLPSSATANAARSATSVLPKPTSPQISRSIGRPLSRSFT